MSFYSICAILPRIRFCRDLRFFCVNFKGPNLWSRITDLSVILVGGHPRAPEPAAQPLKGAPTILSSASHWQAFRMGDPQEAARFLLLEEEKLEKRSRRKSFFSLGRAFITALIFVWLAWLTLDTKGKFLNLKLSVFTSNLHHRWCIKLTHCLRCDLVQ